MEISTCDFMELTMGEISDLLLERLHENKKEGKLYSQAMLIGKDKEGHLYKLTVLLQDAIE